MGIHRHLDQDEPFSLTARPIRTPPLRPPKPAPSLIHNLLFFVLKMLLLYWGAQALLYFILLLILF